MRGWFMGSGGAVMRTREFYFPCEYLDCIHNVNGLCKLLTDEPSGEKCTFYKTMSQQVLEAGALLATPPDWDAYRKHSGTKPPTRKALYKWVKEMEKLSPCDDAKSWKIVHMYLDHNYISLGDAIHKVKEYLDEHPDGCRWCMSSLETAKSIFEEVVEDADKADKTDAEIPGDSISE